MSWPKKQLKYNIDKNILYNKYIKENYTQQECADFFGVSRTVIIKRLKIFNIEKDSSVIKKQRFNAMQKTMLKRYGRIDVGRLGTKEHNDAMIKKYGTLIAQNIKSSKAKSKKTCLKKYGCEYYTQSEEFKNKSKKTCLKKYGCEYAMQNPKIVKKQKESYFKKTGYENVSQNPEVLRKKCKKYLYNNIKFDSSWELAVWIYAIEHNEKIEREPVALEYFANNKKHFYIPDFRYKNRLIEIKGNHLINEKGELQDFFNNEGKEEIKQKYRCALQNNVIFWKKEDIQFALKYIENKYGKNYLKNFKQK